MAIVTNKTTLKLNVEGTYGFLFLQIKCNPLWWSLLRNNKSNSTHYCTVSTHQFMSMYNYVLTIMKLTHHHTKNCGHSRYSDQIYAEQFVVQLPVEATFCAPFQTDLPRDQTQPSIQRIPDLFLEVKRSDDVHLPHLAPQTAIPVLPLWPFLACYKVNFIFTFYHYTKDW